MEGLCMFSSLHTDQTSACPLGMGRCTRWREERGEMMPNKIAIAILTSVDYEIDGAGSNNFERAGSAGPTGRK